MFYFSD